MALPYEWMRPTDREILEVLERSRQLKVGGLWMNPATVARNINRTRGHVNARLRELQDHGLAESDGDGYYRITDEGTDVLKEI